MKNGFTLIELLVVVLIIGILAAIALPMYQKAVLRSRFAALMPIAKSMADSNEAYYLEHGRYANDPQDLPVQGQTEYPTGTTLEFGSNLDYAYVLAHNQDARNNYIVYQKHSANYPGEIHCEAVTGDELAESICAAYGNNNIGPTLTDGYTTYIIEGIGAGIPAGAGDNEMNCNKADELGLTCSVTTNAAGEQEKKVCSQVGNTIMCRTRTYDEEGGYTSVTCQANSDNVCLYMWHAAVYDKNGNMVSKRYCSTIAEDGSCSAYSYGYDYTYDDNKNMIRERRCNQVAADGSCSQYSTGATAVDYTYDANGNKISERYCGTVAADGTCSVYWNGRTEYTYDANGNKTSQLSCSQVAADGSCSSYTGTSFSYTYDDNGKQTSQRYCKTVASDGSCSAYNTSGNYDYTYDAQGNQTGFVCGTVAADGTCSTYNSGYTYTYDTDGKTTSYQTCSTLAADGSCSVYGWGIEYTYDTNGNLASQRICNARAADGSCSEYGSGNNYDYTYDAHGNKISERYCKTVAADGSCSEYRTYGNYDYIYDDNDQQISTHSCNEINTSTGDCAAYYGTSVYIY